MILEHKEITFHINNSAYTVDIGPDLDHCIENGLKTFIDFSAPITTQELLLAYLRKTQELIHFKKELENQIENLNNFNENL